MAKISTYPDSGAIQAADAFVIARGGANYKVTGNRFPIVLQASALMFNPADSQTYYFGSFPGEAPTTTATIRKIFFQRAGNVTSVRLWIVQATGLGTGEASSAYLRKNNTTDTLISNAISNAVAGGYTIETPMSVAMVAGDYAEIKWVTPAWVTNPIGTLCMAQIFYA